MVVYKHFLLSVTPTQFQLNHCDRYIMIAMTPFQNMKMWPTQKHHVTCRTWVPSLVWSTACIKHECVHEARWEQSPRLYWLAFRGQIALLISNSTVSAILTLSIHPASTQHLSGLYDAFGMLWCFRDDMMLYGSRAWCQCLALNQWNNLFLQIYHPFQAQYWFYWWLRITNKLQILEGFLRNFQRDW